MSTTEIPMDDTQGWRTDIENMPQGRTVDVMRVEEAAVMATEGYVKEPITGRMFIPQAWREKPND